eukprot:6137113-Alexandrium_andersonii.AAC.1
MLEVEALPALVELRVQPNGAGAVVGVSGPMETLSGGICAVVTMPGKDGDSHTEPIFFATNGKVEVVARLPVQQQLAGQFIGQWAAVQATRARFMVAAARMTALGRKRWGLQGDGVRPAENARAVGR